MFSSADIAIETSAEHTATVWFDAPANAPATRPSRTPLSLHTLSAVRPMKFTIPHAIQ